MRDLHDDGEDFDIEGDFGEYNNNNINSVGTKSKPRNRRHSNAASLKNRDDINS